MDKPRAGLSQRIFAWALARSRFSRRYEEFAAPYKQQLFTGLSGTLLEIGPGIGVNLHYFRRDTVHWIGVGPNVFMDPYLRREAARSGVSPDLRVGTADHLPVIDGSVDAVISTLVLCCVPDQRRALQEIIRALKPGGQFVFLEHVAAARGTRLRSVQDLITPMWRRLGDGCCPNRETWSELERAGFSKLTYERITAPVPVVSPQIVGVALKP